MEWQKKKVRGKVRKKTTQVAWGNLIVQVYFWTWKRQLGLGDMNGALRDNRGKGKPRSLALMPSLITFTSERTVGGNCSSTMTGRRENYSLEKNDRTKPQSVQKVHLCHALCLNVCVSLFHTHLQIWGVCTHTQTSDCQVYRGTAVHLSSAVVKLANWETQKGKQL